MSVPTSRMFLMTGYSDVKVAELLGLGARGVFKKPFDVDKMIRNIEAVLDETAPSSEA